MFWNLLSSADSLGDGVKGCSKGDLLMLLPMVAIFALFIWWSRSSQKKREKEVNETLNAMKPGDTVKTIGGICGVVVELCPDEDAFVLETGSETTGKSYITFDKRMSVYQTDAAVETQTEEQATTEKDEFFDEPQAEEQAQPVEETAEEVAEEPAEEIAEETTETATEETAEETTEEVETDKE